MLKVNNALWIISDTHFGHKNIVRYQQRPESHEVIMLSHWIERVREDQQILHLGDVFLGKQGNPRRWALVISRLPGEKYLIKGNHDKAEDELYELAGFTIIEPFVHRGFAFTHRPISADYPDLGRARSELHPTQRDKLNAQWHTNIHGHIHGNVLGSFPDHDGRIYTNKHYVNVCVEVMDFAPQQLGNIWS